MTREAVEQGFHEFVDDIVDRTYREFDVVAVLRGGTSVSGRLVSNLLKNAPAVERTFVRPELRTYKQDVFDQIEVVLDYAEDPDADPDEYREAMLAHDTYYDHIRDDLPEERKAEIADVLVGRQIALGDAARPLIGSDENEFWAAVEEKLSKEEAIDLVQTHFEFTEPARDYPDAFRFASRFDASKVLGNIFSLGVPRLRVEYTDEVVRAMHEAERETIERVLADIDRRYD